MNSTTNQSATQGKRFMRRTSHEVRMLMDRVGGLPDGDGWGLELPGPPTAGEDFIFGFGSSSRV